MCADVTVKGPPSLSRISAPRPSLLRIRSSSQSPGVLVIAPISPDKLVDQVKAAREPRAVKIVVIDTPEWKSLADVYVDLERDQMCAAAAKLCESLASDGDEISIFRHVQSDPGVHEREESAIAQLRVLNPKLVIHADVYASAVIGEEKAPGGLPCSANIPTPRWCFRWSRPPRHDGDPGGTPGEAARRKDPTRRIRDEDLTPRGGAGP